MVKKGISLYAILICLMIALLSRCGGPDHKSRPNIILIVSDDLGYSDLGCYGGEIQTPNLDRLASRGLRFTQFYNYARCCPTRASLMTGLYPHQTGIGHMTNYPPNPGAHDYGLPGYRGFLNMHCVTIAEVLKGAGYHTFMTGKWHLGFFGEKKWPLQRGFDEFYGLIPGACNYFRPVYPRGMTSGNDTVSIRENDFYTTNVFTDYAIRFIEEARRNDSQPFFLYLAYNAPHWPLNAPAEDIAKYKGKYMMGWKELRLKRYRNMQQMGLVNPNWELTPQDSRDWDSLDESKKKEMDLRMAIYAAMVDRMDQNIGKLTAFLEEQNLLRNTIIIFLSDNGGCAEFSELGNGPVQLLGTRQGYVLTYGRAWANASNTPFREYKHWVHEGGISTPLIVHWPEGIPANIQGNLVHEYGFLPDIMATCIDLAGTEYPEDYKGNQIYPLEGLSLLPLIRGSGKPVHIKPIFWEHEGNKAVRLGKYKLVHKWTADHPASWELYDMEADRTEMNNLAPSMPEKVAELDLLYEEWASGHQVIPWEDIRQIIQKLNR